MTGIEKIIEKIENDCNATCEEILAKAQAEAQVILQNAQIAGEKVKKEAAEAVQKECQMNLELAASKAEHERKKAILATKSILINDSINASMQKLKSLPDAEYFNVIKMLINRYAQKGQGIIRFSKEDSKRIPQSFEAEINAMLQGNDKSIVISSETVAVDGGFVIIYQDVEQNCSFDSLLNASLDEIKDELYQEIFMRDSK